MLLTTQISLKLQGGNIHYYESLGYTNIKVKDTITIPIEHLPKTSHEKVLIKCDKCGEEKESHYFAYNKYLRNSLDNEYLCNKCNDKNRKNTLLKRYGVNTLIHNEEFNNKRKKTMIEKFGFEHPCQSEEIKQKIVKTNLERYGVEHPAQLKEFRDKINETNLEKYGNINSLVNEKTLEKTFKTMIEKYGVKYSAQNKELMNNISETLQKTRIKNVLEKNENIIEIDYDKSTYVVKCDQNKEHNFTINTHLYCTRKKFNIPICTICNTISSNISGPEIIILNFIKENYNGEIILNCRSVIKPYELDIYLPELKLAFEYNGLYWHSENHKDKNYHLNKTEMCENSNIQLMHIWEDDWLFKQDIIKSIILNKICENKIDIDKYEIRNIQDEKIIKKFLTENHIHGYVKSDIKLGLYDDDELISLMIFKSKNSYELLRCCNKLNLNLNNSEKILFDYFIKKYSPSEVISKINRAYHENFIDILSFKIQNYTKPNCYYIRDFVRYKKNKSNENCLKIYDSGNLILKFNI